MAIPRSTREATVTALEPVSLGSLFGIFLKIGTMGFGGFMSLIAVVEQNIVQRRKLLAHEEILDAMSLASILPGPQAMNVIAFVGHRLRGGVGALVAAVAVSLPSYLLMLGLTIAYFEWGQLAAVTRVFMGFVPAVAAIIFNAAWVMRKQAVTGLPEALIAITAAGLLLFAKGFFITLGIVVGAGVLGWLLFREKSPVPGATIRCLSPLVVAPLLTFDVTLLGKIFVTFAGMSVFLFGGGYVFIPMIQKVVVDTQHWVTQKEFIDGIALGQIMPGPILISAAFIGYKVAGILGSIVASIGIFGPPAILMVLATSAYGRIRKSAIVKSVLRGIRPAVVGMIFAAVLTIAKTAPMSWVSVMIAAGALLALMRFKLDVVWILPSAGVVGLVLL
ncbi:MAG: chromate efflux transporter [Candidatus Rokubacteria bacterium]|nr:chromate efflux transporter [Candidatus Rokubacteria bacterium]